MRRFFIVYLLVFTLAFAALANAQTDPREGPIRTLLQQHFVAMKKENIAAVLATIHPQSPVYSNTESMLRQLFQAYDLAYEWRITKIGFQGDALAYVEMEQTTRRVSGPAFRDNRIRSRSEMRKHQGKWKLFNTKIDEVDYLN